jgi:type II secretory pathway predicted ATPase ExeA/septal ring-binding cell division protein DamX
MYHEHYGLNAAPFKITPDTHLFFQGATRGDILGAIEYAILNGEGIIKVVGEVGSGKTMLCRMLEVQLPDNVEIAYLANPSLSPDDILHAIAFEMKLPVTHDANRLSVMQALQQALLDKHANNQQVVVFIEEAQRMPLDTLEEIRLLSNLETSQHKLLQMVMFGQPELDANLAQENIRQLKERITQSFYLSPFSQSDIGDYLNYRMQHVGYRGPDVFSPQAIKVISDVSQGLARRVNILADKALMAAFAQNTHSVSRQHARQAVEDSEFSDNKRLAFSLYKPLTAATLGGFVALAIVYLLLTPIQQNPPGIDNTASSRVMTQPQQQAEPTGPAASTNTIVKSDSVITPDTPVIHKEIPADISPQVDSPEIMMVSETITPTDTNNVRDTPISTVNKYQPELTVTNTQNLTDARIAAADQWLDVAKSGHYSIQIMMLRKNEAQRDLEKFLQRADIQPYIDMMYIYRTTIKGQPMTGVVYGEYQNYKQAIKALKQLPDPMKKHGPHLRTVKGLRQDIRQLDMDA